MSENQGFKTIEPTDTTDNLRLAINQNALKAIEGLEGKVDKVDGKELSTKDFTAAYEAKLKDIEKNANNYTHPPAHDASMITENASKRFVADTEKTAWNSKANGTDVNSHIADVIKHVTVGERTSWNTVGNKVDKITGKSLSTNDYTTEEKAKLAGVSPNANNYDHPVSHTANMIVESADKRFTSDTEKTAWNSKAEGNHTHADKADASTVQALSNTVTSLDSAKADKSAITTFNATATYASNIVSITVQNGSTTNYTVTFTAPSDFVAENTYRINGVVIAVMDLNGKAVKNAWVSGSAVTLSVVGAKAFFKAGGEFSSGDLLPVGRFENVPNRANPQIFATDIPSFTNAFANGYVRVQNYTVDRDITITKLYNACYERISTGRGTDTNYIFNQSISSFINNQFVYLVGNKIVKINMDDTTQKVEKTISYSDPCGINVTDKFIYGFYTTGKLIKFDVNLNIIWVTNYKRYAFTYANRLGSRKQEFKVCRNGCIYIGNTTEKRYDIINDLNGDVLGNSVSWKGYGSDWGPMSIDNDGYLFINKFAYSTGGGNWLQRYAPDGQTLEVDYKFNSYTSSTLCSVFCDDNIIWVKDYSSQDHILKNNFVPFDRNIVRLIDVACIPSKDISKEFLVGSSDSGDVLCSYYDNGYDYGYLHRNVNSLGVKIKEI